MEQKKVYAKSKYIRMSAQKVRLVADMVRGENALYASEMLDFVNKAAALPLKKTIDSAIANASNNFDMDKKELRIVEIMVDEAPTYKRGRAVSKGRYHQIFKRNCHIVVVVSDGSDVSKIDKKKKVTPKVEEKKSAPKKQTAKKAMPIVAKSKTIDRKSQVKQVTTQRKTQNKG